MARALVAPLTLAAGLVTAFALSGQHQPAAAPAPGPQAAQPAASGPAVIHPDEGHFRNLRQLTFGGQNAEGYWSPDGRQIIFQSPNEAEGGRCDPQFVLA